MTRKDYVLIAAAMAACKPRADDKGYSEKRVLFHDILAKLAESLSRENPAFDRVKFWRYVFGVK